MFLTSTDTDLRQPPQGEFTLHPTVDDPNGVKSMYVKVRNGTSGTATTFHAMFFPGRLDVTTAPKTKPNDAIQLFETNVTGEWEGFVPACLIAINAVNTLVVWPDAGDGAVRTVHITDAAYYVKLNVAAPSVDQAVNADGTVNFDITDISATPVATTMAVKVFPGFIDAESLPWTEGAGSVIVSSTTFQFTGAVPVGEVPTTMTGPLKKTLAMWPLVGNQYMTAQGMHFMAKP
jgi:hypothetical protein